MDANEREGESDPIAIFIRVYSCPFAVEICSYSTCPRPITICFALGPEDWKNHEWTRMNAKGNPDPIAVFIRVYSWLKFAPIGQCRAKHV